MYLWNMAKWWSNVRRSASLGPFSGLALLLFLAAGGVARGQAGSLTCIEVNAAGNVSLGWEQPADPAGLFLQYVYHDFQPGNPANASSTNIPNYGTTSIVAPGIDGNSTARCFYVQSMFTDGTVTSTDTLCNIHLSVAPSVVPGFADLTWNSPRIAALGGGSGGAVGGEAFEVQKWMPGSGGSGVWTTLATVTDNGGILSYAYEVTDCAEDLQFRILQDVPALGCTHQSNTSGDSFNDELDPDAPVITHVDVNPALSDAEIHWTPSPAADLAGYIIYLCTAGFQTPIDTIFDPTATSYLNLQSNAGSIIESYNVAAFDSCYVNGQPDPGAASQQCATTITLSVSREACSDEALLNWMGAYGWAGTILEGQIHGAQELPPGSGTWTPPTLLGTVGPGVTSWVHTGVPLGSTWRYHVALVTSTGATGLSQRRTLSFDYPEAPAGTRIRRATVDEVTGGVEVVVDLDPASSDPHRYILERKRGGDDDSFYAEIAVQDAVGALGAAPLIFLDSAVQTASKIYTYRVRIVNGCGDAVGETPSATTMLLSGIPDAELMRNTLTWSPYLGFPGSVAGYRVYRRAQRDGTPTLVASLPPNLTTHEDDVSALLDLPGDFCYVIEAVDSQGSPTGGINYALSNSVCLTQPPLIWVPNAILTSSEHEENRIFRPVISFADLSSFVMEVYGRWGDVIYSTTDIEQGWDGRWNGEWVKEGAYGFSLVVQDGAGRAYTETGLVYVLHNN